jgi:hypothetical protein
MPAADMDRAATFYGRLMGENMAHEIGHFATFVAAGHAGTGLTEPGGSRTSRERTGFAIDTSGAGPLLTDNGRATVNELDADHLRTFEDFLPIDPPIDQSRFVERGGRVGSFSRAQGWVVGAARARQLSGETTVHLPGATVLDGWEADAFVFALETAIRSVLATNPATLRALRRRRPDPGGLRPLRRHPRLRPIGDRGLGAGAGPASRSSLPPATASASREPAQVSSATSTTPERQCRQR